MIIGVMLILTVVLLLLGVHYLGVAKEYEGITVSYGYHDGRYHDENEIELLDFSSTFGSNPAEKERFNNMGLGCIILAGLCGIICVIVKVVDKD